MFLVRYLCPYQPVWRDDLETPDWTLACQRAQQVAAQRGTRAVVIDERDGQVYFQV
jgi:hypothetical protein